MRADEDQSVFFAGGDQLLAFRQETVTGMDGVDTNVQGGFNNCIAIEVRVSALSSTDQ